MCHDRFETTGHATEALTGRFGMAREAAARFVQTYSFRLGSDSGVWLDLQPLFNLYPEAV